MYFERSNGRKSVYEPAAPRFHSPYRSHDPNAYGRFGVEHAKRVRDGQAPAKGLQSVAPKRYTDATHRANKTKAERLLREENAKEAVCWGLQAGGCSVADIEENADLVLRDAKHLSETQQLAAEEEQRKLTSRPLHKASIEPVENTVDYLRNTMRCSSKRPHTPKERLPKQVAHAKQLQQYPFPTEHERPVPSYRRTRKKPDPKAVLPFEQVRTMFQERMESIMLQNRQAVRSAWKKFDTKNSGELNLQQFQGMMQHFGIDLPLHQVQDFLCKVSEDCQPRMFFSDFLQNVLGLPHDFFSMKFTGPSADDALQKKKVSRVFSRNVPVKKVHKALVKGMRNKIFDIGMLRTIIFRPKPGVFHFGLDEMWNVLRRLGILTKPGEVKEVHDFFDLRHNGKINMLEFLAELLTLPCPPGVSMPEAYIQERIPLSKAGEVLVHRMRRAVEREALKGGRMQKIWGGYDRDGSGKVSYDEIAKMMVEFNIGMESKNAAAELLKEMDHTQTGCLSYEDFVTDVVGCDPEEMREGNRDRPSTPALRHWSVKASSLRWSTAAQQHSVHLPYSIAMEAVM